MEFSFNKITQCFENALEVVYHNKKQVVFVVVGAIVFALFAVGYVFYDRSLQAQAHKDFMEANKHYEATVVSGSKAVVTGESYQFGSDEEKWKSVEEIYANGAVKYRGTGLGPVFKAYQAEAMLRRNNLDGAIETLAGALSAFKSNEVKEFYALKLALMKMDSTKGDVFKEGFAYLKQMAEKSSSTVHESALYYLGAYFWAQKDYAQTRNYWQQLMVQYGLKDAKQQAGFAELVKPKLKLISAEW